MLSHRILYVIERIKDILKLNKENDTERISDELKTILDELVGKLFHSHEYLNQIEEKDDEKELSEFEEQFCRFLKEKADDIDNHLDGINTHHDVAHHIKEIVNNISKHSNPLHVRIKNVSKNNINHGGTQNAGTIALTFNLSDRKRQKTKRYSRPESNSKAPKYELVGVDHEIETLVDHLIKPDNNWLAGIVGMGGLGKTTLAKHIFHHPEIKSHFRRKAWVCVSESPNKTNIIDSILSQIDQNYAGKVDYDEGVKALQKQLLSESYLIILDDIWSIDPWYDIDKALPNCTGRKVVVTTRNTSLLEDIDDDRALSIQPKPLEYEKSVELFNTIVFGREESISPNLQKLREEMVKKCEGLPLAIVALAGVLKKKEIESWDRIKGKMLKIKDSLTHGRVNDILAMSYSELSHNLKPCVLYLRVFPDDCEINAKRLIQMWKAEGFINNEDEGEEYLDEIAEQCIVEVVRTNYTGQVLRLQIHDLMREVLININEKSGLFKDPLRLAPSSNTSRTSEAVSEAVSIEDRERTAYSKKNSRAHSIILSSYLDIHESTLLSSFCRKFKVLRVLILSDISGSSMPEEIGGLIHLRYLELGGRLKHLPKSIENLVNLQTLNMKDVFNCKLNSTTPKNFNKLEELRHLYWPSDWNNFGEIVVKSKNLETLYNAKGGMWMLKGMQELSNVLKELTIYGIDSQQQLEALFQTPSIASEKLHTLELLGNNVVFRDLSQLCKCESLLKFKLWGKIRIDIPIELPKKLIKLELKHSFLKNKDLMDNISESCQCLEYLTLGIWSYKGSILKFTANSFPELKNLSLEHLDDLNYLIIERGAMPKLHHLKIDTCSSLEDLNLEGWERILGISQPEYNELGRQFIEKLRAYKKYAMGPIGNDYHVLRKQNIETTSLANKRMRKN